MKAAASLAGRFVLIWSACIAVFVVQWVQETFGEVSLGQILFHWKYLGGSDSVANVVVGDFLVKCVGGSLVCAVLITWLDRRLVKPWLQEAPASPRRRWSGRLSVLLPWVAIAASVATLAVRTSALQFLSPMGSTDYFAAHYVPPGSVGLKADKPKNLVMVYVESLEASYNRTDVFGRDLLASLSDLNPVSFRNYEQLPGTGYTIAAMISTQCGLPLQMVGVLDWQKQGESVDEFLPGAVCLSDLLDAHGYRNVFMGGASLNFSGKGKFLHAHHFHESYGRVEWKGMGVPAQRMSGWGLHDDDLFAQAKVKLRQLHEAGQPFNLTILTVDSHGPSGIVSEGCGRRGAQELEGVLECTAEMVADLVRFVRTSGYDEDTNIVVIGDHLSPPNSVSDKLARVDKRSIYNAFFSRSTPPVNRSTVVHFDMLPTILDFIGLRVENGREGLGFSAFGPPPVPFPTARSRAELGANLLSPSRAYFALWKPAAGQIPAPPPTRPEPR